ncbi:M14 family metallocarboxypeptidase [Ramlibacter sp. H39-3-26]|uniref:M14 family metallopeptidase n=1 Tax=Curvibacter soli TaxID=3031331 RepID=UPI0023DC31E7|nr:M14 family metallocarboxypeptidase [Ramlibacter sp. H39-3-26]MDF1484418.1 M14 family metallocarboxypeptidase [Ramlibacter sp. H39-3-26]
MPAASPHAADSARHAAVRRPWALVAGALLLAGCASTPLPPWPDASRKPPASAAATPARPAPMPAPAPSGAVVTPIPATPAPATAVPEATDQPAAESAAVAARFPDPAVRYSTPGLAPDRRAFTTNAEAHNWLSTQALGSVGRAPTLAAVRIIGTSQRGQPIEALVVTRATGTDPDSLQTSKRPTVLLIGQQHGDEPAGAEALLVVARELSQGLLEPLLDRINVVIVPRANPDGADTGTRTTANGADMNRDHLVLNTPEAQALARVSRDYFPILVLDAHEYTAGGRYLQKFNAVQRYDALLQYATTANVPEFLTRASEEWYRRPMVAALDTQALASQWHYTTSTDPQDLRLSMGGAQPDTGRNVNGLKNSVSFLVETRGVGMGRAHIQRRVHTQVTAIASALQSTAERADKLREVRSFVERDIAAQACRGAVAVQAEPTPEQRDITFIDPATGADKVVKVQWESSLALRTVKSRARPCGYWLAPSAADAVERLRLLGLQVLRVAEPGSLLADAYRETARATGPRQNARGAIADAADSVGTVRVEVALARSALDVAPGSFYVPLAQPLANLAVAALEPDTQNGFFANHVIDSLDATARVMAPPSLVLEEMR